MKARESNFELLRCVAIFMIIAVHADYWLFKMPTQADLETNPSGTFWRMFWECVTVIGTNVFVLISGWFSIRPSLKSFLSFIFQIEFFFLGIYIIGVLTGLSQFSFKSLAICFLFTSNNWFIKSYIGLYICAPILNAFIEKVNRSQFLLTILLFFVFQTLYGWTSAARFVEQGYSTFSFFGLYLIGRYLNIYNLSNKLRKIRVFLLCGSILANVALSLYFINTNLLGLSELMISYVNPLVITGAIGLLLVFARLTLGSNKIINRIGKSTFAVYLFPCWFIFNYIYRDVITNIYNTTSGVVCLIEIMGVLIVTFVCSILVDQIRIIIWDYIWKHISPFIENKKLSY